MIYNQKSLHSVDLLFANTSLFIANTIIMVSSLFFADLYLDIAFTPVFIIIQTSHPTWILLKYPEFKTELTNAEQKTEDRET